MFLSLEDRYKSLEFFRFRRVLAKALMIINLFKHYLNERHLSTPLFKVNNRLLQTLVSTIIVKLACEYMFKSIYCDICTYITEVKQLS